jgi:hypothetical protein
MQECLLYFAVDNLSGGPLPCKGLVTLNNPAGNRRATRVTSSWLARGGQLITSNGDVKAAPAHFALFRVAGSQGSPIPLSWRPVPPPRLNGRCPFS